MINKNAFTLIELLIVVSIVMLVSLAIIPSYVDFAAQKDFNNKVEVIVSQLMDVRNKALSGAVYIDGSGIPHEANWGFKPEDCTTQRYYLGYQLPPSGSFVNQVTLDLPVNISFGKGASSTTACDTIIFERLKGTPIMTGSETEQEIILKYKSSTRTITVNSAGRISYN